MRIIEHRTGEIAIITLAGSIRGWNAASALDDCFRRETQSKDVATVLLDLSKSWDVDTIGLDAMLRRRQLLRYANATVHRAGLTERLDDLVVITRLATLCNTFGTTADAIICLAPAFLTTGTTDALHHTGVYTVHA
jgi:anti-anti-sigma regulatory factor